MSVNRTIHVPVLARVEGEGALHVKLKDGAVADVKLRIYEPPRFFEACCAAAASTRPRTSPPASAGSARSPTR